MNEPFQPNSEASVGSAALLIASPPAWSPLLENADDAMDAEERRLLRAIVQRLHGDHIGIGLAAATGLARLLGPSPPLDRLELASPWSRLPHRLAAVGIWRPDATTITPEASLAAGLRRQAHSLMARLIGPLVRRACDEIGLCILFGGGGHATPADFATRYAEYEAASAGVIERLIEGDECALLMESWSLIVAARDRDAAGLGATALSPQEDAVAMAMALRLEPPPPRLQPLRQAAARLTKRNGAERHGVFPQQGGVTGIRQSRRHEDLDQMLDSEFLLPRVLRMERVANTGFLIRDRPPHRQPRRDLLIMSVVDAGGDGDAVRLVQASWLLFLLGVLPTLRDQAMARTDLVWIDSDRNGLAALHRCAADEDESWRESLGNSPPTGQRRGIMLDRLRCLPNLMNRRRAATIRLPALNDDTDIPAWFKANLHAYTATGDRLDDIAHGLFLLSLRDRRPDMAARSAVTRRLVQAVEQSPGGPPPAGLLAVLWMPPEDGGRANGRWSLTSRAIGSTARTGGEKASEIGPAGGFNLARRDDADRASGALLEAWNDQLARVL